MKLLVLGDSHGKVPKVNTENFDAIICVGDFVQDATLRKIIFSAISKGLYWRDMISASKLKKILRQDCEAGMKVLEWLGKQHRPVFFIPGNWDMNEQTGKPFYTGKLGRYKNLIDCDEKLVVTQDFCIIGYGKTSGPEIPTTIVDKKEHAIKVKAFNRKVKQLSKLFVKARKTKKPIIFLIHNPPYGTKLDKVNMKSSPAFGKHVGSQVATKLISKFSPSLCICGHIHENSGYLQIKQTLCLNAGCLHDKKQKVYCIDMPELN